LDVKKPSCRLIGALALAAAVVSSGCGDSGPTQPTPGAPKITCPTNVSRPSVDNNGVQVSWLPPTVTGGTQPVTVQCTPPSPNVFPIGTTSVSCSATDAVKLADSCTFQVTITAPPRITATSFMAFGDSMSDGVLGLTALSSAPGDPGPVVGYAYKLRQLLRDRYTAQTITMTDEGCPGETVSTPTPPNCPGGIYRMPTALSRDRPQAVLLLEGINDLNGSGGDAISTVVNGLRTMVRQARGSGLPVFIATLPPEGNGFRARDGAKVAIPPTNEQIKFMASTEGAFVVDLFAAFDGKTDTLIGPDGLHPNDAGYAVMAQTFFDVIKTRLEAPATTLMPLTFPVPRR